MARPAPARPTRPLPRRRSVRLAPWLVSGALALVVVGGAAAWSAFGRAPDAPRLHLALAAPPTATAPAGQGVAADQNPVVVAPRPTAVRASAAAVRPPSREVSPGPVARTVPVAAPPADDATSCADSVPAPRRPITCPPAPAPPREDLRTSGRTR